eukprot:COSAG06_NODE_41327_length_392_cov_1.150171_1_plen_23_part_10
MHIGQAHRHDLDLGFHGRHGLGH